jgi:hypothetical protein
MDGGVTVDDPESFVWENAMRFLSIFSSISSISSAVIVLFGLVNAAQAQTVPNPAPLWGDPVEEPASPPTSSLGGPITVIQPASLSSEPVVSPSALELDAKSLGLQVVRRSNRPAAPFVDDPPRIGGGFINVQTD